MIHYLLTPLLKLTLFPKKKSEKRASPPCAEKRDKFLTF